MAVQFHPGLQPNDPRKARLYARMFLKAGVTPPATVDYSGFTPIGMLGNDSVGDCVEAGAGHVFEQQTFYGQGSEYAVSTQQAISMYSQVTGYNPADPNTDQGTVLQDGLDYMRKTGIGGHKIAAFAQLDPTNMNEVKTAVAEFGTVMIGFPFPDSAMDQFNKGQPWDVVPGATIDGGHCVIVVGYTSAYLLVITWGAVQKMTYAFWNTYVAGKGQGGEAWALVDQEWVNKQTGKDPEGVDLTAFGAQYAALTNQPNPFPNSPTPTPVPTPTPTPTPVPVGPDATEIALAGAAHRWMDRYFKPKYMVTALENWLTDKNL